MASTGISFTKMTALAANGQTAAVVLGVATEVEVAVYIGAGATWGGGTLILQQSFDGGTTWFTVPNASWTAGVANTLLGRVTLQGGGQVRGSLSGSTTPTLNVDIKAERIDSRSVKQFTFAADGSSAVFQISDNLPKLPVTTRSIEDLVLAWAAQGTWGSGTLVLEVSPDGGTTWYKQLAGLTANGIQYVAGVSDSLGRFTLSGSTTPALTVFAVY